MSEKSKPTWTLDVLDWRPWVETLYEVDHTPEFLAEAEAIAPNIKSSTYFATLAHDLPALVQRTALFSSAMRSSGGASNDERELAAVVTSRINGCVYCASVHARMYNQYAKKPAVIEEIYEYGVEGRVQTASTREQAIIEFSAKLTQDHGDLTPADLEPLREAGLTDLDILDVTQSAAMFAWANRLMLTLGEGELPEGKNA